MMIGPPPLYPHDERKSESQMITEDWEQMDDSEDDEEDYDEFDNNIVGDEERDDENEDANSLAGVVAIDESFSSEMLVVPSSIGVTTTTTTTIITTDSPDGLNGMAKHNNTHNPTTTTTTTTNASSSSSAATNTDKGKNNMIFHDSNSLLLAHNSSNHSRRSNRSNSNKSLNRVKRTSMNKDFSTSHKSSLRSSSTDHGSVASSDSVTTDDYSFATRDSSIRTDRDSDTIHLAYRETMAVRCLRPTVVGALIVLGILLALGLFETTRRKEREEFQDEFELLASQIATSWTANVQRTMTVLDAFGLHVSIAATETAIKDNDTINDGSSWPFVTVPEFATQFTSSQLIAPAIQSISLVPIVSNNDREDYEAYSVEHQEWIEQSLEWQLQQEQQNEKQQEDTARRMQQIFSQGSQPQTPVSLESGIANTIFQKDTNDHDDTTITLQAMEGDGPFFPIRQLAPVPSRFQQWINYDIHSNDFIRPHLTTAVQSQEIVLGPLLSSEDAKVEVSWMDLLPPQSINVTQNATNSSSTIGTLLYPILSQDNNNKNDTLVGVLSALISWPLFVSNILPNGVHGLICVLESTCSSSGSSSNGAPEERQQQISMRINGPNVLVLGSGDQHDKTYDHLQMMFTFDSLNLVEFTTGHIDLNDDGDSCRFELFLYPSVELEHRYVTGNPRRYAIGIGVIFFMTAIVFIIYDCIVERRQRLISKSAMEARAIVSSLFPAVVRDRLFENTREREKFRKKNKDSKAGNKDNMATNQPPHDITPNHGSLNLNIISESPCGSVDMERAPNGDGMPTNLSPNTMKQIMGGLAPPSGSASPHKHSPGASSSKAGSSMLHPKHRLKNFLAHGPTSRYMDDHDDLKLAKPIADLFPHTTVLFADIAGFTAWSSEREPEQVFTLLQTVYHAFDKIAKRRGVFKVETIGDCYVAVTGLPDPQPDHAVRMTKFGRECMARMTEVTKRLEVALGPDTGDLCMRLGLHSGPVTAGVLQGEKSRFQLFGDTVNTASRMESTGERNRIQVSQSTAELLIEAGKSYWIKPREDLVTAKGKGEIQTYWVVARTGSSLLTVDHGAAAKEESKLLPSRSKSALVAGNKEPKVQRSTSDSLAKMMARSANGTSSNEKRKERLIEWQCEMFLRLLKKIVAARGETMIRRHEEEKQMEEMDDSDHQALTPLRKRRVLGGGMRNRMDALSEGEAKHSSQLNLRLPERKISLHNSVEHNSDNGEILNVTTVMDEVAEVITLPKFDPKAIKALADSDSVDLGDKVSSQLHDYIKTIASMYRSNPFHNFEHASHVTMSANKLLNRIVIPENVDYQRESNAIASDLHDYTYGITSDPLTQFAVVFSALVHDVDHTGVPNAQLAKENPEMARVYRNQSVAEQNSVDLAWELFMDPRYKDLQQCIYSNDEERLRFRQLVVNSVMATDIFDKDMKALRNKRWEKAFHLSAEPVREMTEQQIDQDANMKATIVIEHIIQASDVAHTMQHWHIYQKWNERLFEEMYTAYDCGRSEKNPADGWFKGELWFFDNYVIPLAKKLEECHVFGVASDECLNYARANRSEWNVKGEDAVREMVARYESRKFHANAGAAAYRLPRSPRPPVNTSAKEPNNTKQDQ